MMICPECKQECEGEVADWGPDPENPVEVVVSECCDVRIEGVDPEAVYETVPFNPYGRAFAL